MRVICGWITSSDGPVAEFSLRIDPLPFALRPLKDREGRTRSRSLRLVGDAWHREWHM